MQKTIPLYSEQDTIDLAAYLAPLLQPGDIITLSGELGAGKTFFTQQLCKALYVDEPVSSPSYVLLNEYTTGKYLVYHLDLYRLQDEMEVLDLGILDMLDAGIMIIEWPEIAKEILPYQTVHLHFSFDGESRSVIVEGDDKYLALIQ